MFVFANQIPLNSVVMQSATTVCLFVLPCYLASEMESKVKSQFRFSILDIHLVLSAAGHAL